MTISVLISLLRFPGQASAHADPKAAAREHFSKGVAAFEDRRFAEAADEFEAAYAISPAYAVLYNIGQVNVALGRSVEAVNAFERYLKQGASSIPAVRRAEVEAEIVKQRARIGTIAVRTLPEGAEVRVDGRLVGKTPLTDPIPLPAGPHAVEAILAGHATQVQEIDVKGRADVTVHLTLPAILSPVPPTVREAPTPMLTPSPAATTASPHESTIGNRPVALGKRDSSVNWQRLLGYAVALGGITAMTLGGLRAYDGATKANDARDRLINAATPEAYDAAEPDFRAGKARNQSGWTIAGVGAGALVGGVLLVVTAPDRSNSVTLVSWISADWGGLGIQGAW